MPKQKSERKPLLQYLRESNLGCPVCEAPEREEIAEAWREMAGATARGRYGMLTHIYAWLIEVRPDLAERVTPVKFRSHMKNHVGS